MITTRIATLQDIEAIREVAEKTWPVSYAEMISPEQIRYMLDRMYTPEGIGASITAKDEAFILAEEEERVIGFAGIQYAYPETDYTRLHKLYLLPEYQGRKVGKLLMQEVEKMALLHGTTAIHLNVNKHNPSLQFYQRQGFRILEETVLDIGNGFVMDDYILVKSLLNPTT